MSLKRLWHGWTAKENADKYQKLLKCWDFESSHYESVSFISY